MMRGRIYWILLAAVCLLLPFRIARAQAPAGATLGPVPLTGLRQIEKQVWHIFGKVTSLDGEAVEGALVRADIGSGTRRAKEMTTDARGEFKTDFELPAETYTSLSVKLTANKAAYSQGLENVVFARGKTGEIDLILRPERDDPDQISLPDLIAALGPRLRMKAAMSLTDESVRREYVRGVREFLDSRNTSRAVPDLIKATERNADCVACRTLLALAMLEAGSWASGSRELARAGSVGATQAAAARSAEPLVALGELESWRRQDKKATAFFMQALDLSPSDPLILQELGRALIRAQNWEAADHYLEKAVAAGASKETLLLRARALVEEGALDAANLEIKAYLGHKDIRDLPPSSRRIISDLRTRIEIASYGKVTSVVDQPLNELSRAIPELGDLEAVEDQSELAPVLGKVGENVEAFFKNFQNTVSVEKIRQERLDREGKVHETLDQDFRYLLLAPPEKSGLGLEEYRTSSTGIMAAPKGLEGGFMLTSGFASASLPFHPAYQSASAFRLLGHQTIQGQSAQVVAFAQLPQKAKTVERFNAEDKSVFLWVQGVAWVDAASYTILRMRTDLLKAPSAIHLARQTTDIRYHQVRFKEAPAALWLPGEVDVTVEWKGKTFRNLHRYSDFKLFNVETEEKRKAAEVPSVPTEKPTP